MLSREIRENKTTAKYGARFKDYEYLLRFSIGLRVTTVFAGVGLVTALIFRQENWTKEAPWLDKRSVDYTRVQTYKIKHFKQ